MKKLLLVLLCVGAIGFCGYEVRHYFYPDQDAGDVTQPPIEPFQIARALDVDAMAKRMKTNQDVYVRIRDASLKAYAAARPPGYYDTINQEQIRLFAYLWVWQDLYGEGLWQTLEFNAKRELTEATANRDALTDGMDATRYYISHYQKTDAQFDNDMTLAARLEASNYPVEFKLWTWMSIAHGICSSLDEVEDKSALSRTAAALPDVIKKTTGHFRELIRAKTPDNILTTKGVECLDVTSENAAALKLMADQIDEAFAAEAPESPVRIALQGRFYIDYAWNARGNGFASTVTAEGNRLMQERLLKAQEILEAGYAKYPDFGPISRFMMKVELGQGEGIERLELWFKRAIKADPDDYFAYENKAYYLLPRWYGSAGETWKFGTECVQAGNWASAQPLILAYAAADISEQNHDVFARPEIWVPLEKFFREWLQHYPESTSFRSQFLKLAAMGKHWDVVKEQYPILGNNWDRKVFRDVDYAILKKLADSETKKK